MGSFLIFQICLTQTSPSRTDDFFDPSDAFNQEIFNETTSYWTSDIIDLPTAATSRLARAKTSVKTNPAFEFSGRALGFAYGEVAAYLLVFGDKIAGTAPKALVTSFFGMEHSLYTLSYENQFLTRGTYRNRTPAHLIGLGKT